MIVMVLMVSAMFIGHTEEIYAASYPMMIPDTEIVGAEYEMGEKAELKFTLYNYNGFKYVKAYVNIYYGSSTSGSRVGSISKKFTNEDAANYTVTWNTADKAPGIYTVEYYMEYYSEGDWNETPYGAKTFQITVNGSGEVIGGNTVDTAGEVNFGTEYDIYFSANSTKNYYNKVIVNDRGILTFDITKPQKTDGEYGDLNLSLISEDGKEVWATSTKDVSDVFNHCEYKIGLEAGVYYFNIQSTFRVTSGVIISKYQFDFEKNQYYETEPNNALATADILESGRDYLANIFDSKFGNKDFYKYTANAGNEVIVYLYNYQELNAAGSLYVSISTKLNNGSTKSFSQMKLNEVYDTASYTFTAPETGTYYVEIRSYADNPVEYRICVDVLNYGGGGGTQTPSLNGLQPSNDGNWYKYINGVVDTSYTGLYCDANVGWWLVIDGRVAFEYTGLWCDPNYGWWLIGGGAVCFDYTGLWYDQTYGWWLIGGGSVCFDYTGLWGDVNYGWWLIGNGTVCFDYNGLWNDPNLGWWLINGGTIPFNYTGLYCDPNLGWWYIEGGTVGFGYTGEVYYDGMPYYVVGGKLV